MAWSTSKIRWFFNFSNASASVDRTAFWYFFEIFYPQSWLATISLRGSFATFTLKLKIFLNTVAFLDFSVQIYFQQASWVK
jgi:hypothetical protein